MVKFKLDKLLFEAGNITVAEFSEKCGVNKNTLYAIYNNKSTRIDTSVVERICKALKCSVGDLIEYVPDKD